MLTLCTLFDHNYLDKGLVMYESLKNCNKEFELYILAMSDKCYDILTDLKYEHIKPIRLSDFEDEELLKVKQTRNVGEYCWTCSSSLIRYVLLNYQPEYCTYIDADLYFYSDPKVIIDEMKTKEASVQVIGHRFHKKVNEESCRLVGKYCVEFNTFKNDENGLRLVNIWRNQCLEHCSIDGDGVYWGDQKYLDRWCADYSFCHETEVFGAGVAPWNLCQYKYISKGKIKILEYNGIECPLVFYHFENIQYVSSRKIRTNIQFQGKCDKALIRDLYIDYLTKIDDKKKFLRNNYNIDIILKFHPAVNQYKSKNPIITLKNKIKDLFYLITY